MRRLHLPQGKTLRRRGFNPKLADSKVISMEIVGEFLGVDTDKGIWSYFKTHWLDGFPMPVCEFKRAYFSRVFKGTAAYGYCASKEEKYYGFKGNVSH